MILKKLLTLMVLSAIFFSTLLPTNLAYAATTGTLTAKIVPAIALGCPYHYTLSIQSNALVISGTSPDYSTRPVKIALINPVNYTASSVGADGRVTIVKDPAKSLDNFDYLATVTPTVAKYLNYTLNPAYCEMAPTIMAGSDLTFDFPNIPKIELSTLSDGVYNVWTGYLGTAASDYLYNDEILVVIKGGKASLQILPTYQRYVIYEGSTGWYTGYKIGKWDVRPYASLASYGKWQSGLPPVEE